ncbi:MAG: NAD(P)-dependent oxidoreductase [Paraburkholderia sp.]|jgi:2-hydroxy-3-oxopropionate reductase|nr:NAD(P)-dependent oxidoreductase [Paraburkholderia sp.]
MEQIAMTSKRIGVAGLGVMGTAIAQRLLQCGHHVSITSRRRDAANALLDAGAHWAESPAKLAADCECVIVSANHAAQVESIVFGENGLAQGLDGRADGLLVIDMSTISADQTVALATRAAGSRMGWVDAPLSGGAPAALEGRLTLFLGGAQSDVEKATQVLSSLSNRMTHLGPAGSGQTVKIINQILVGIGLFALSESASLTSRAGLDPQLVVQALSGGRADSVIFREFFAKFANLDYTPTGRIENMLKDMQNAQDLGRAVGLPLPFTSLAADLNRWLVSRGLGDADIAATMEFYRGA